MKCPRCVQRIHRAASSCPHCGFTVEHADELFGADDVVLQKFTDAAGVLRMKEREPMRKLLEKFEAKFPQLFVAVYIGAFEELQSLRQFGFWLLNRAAFSDVDLERPNENGILVVIDVKAKSVGVTFGYSLMPYLSEDSTFEALSAAHPSLLQSEYLGALRLVMGRLEKTLKKGWRRVRRNPDAMLSAGGQTPRPAGELLQRIREGNQVPVEQVEEHQRS
ncbi:TPM domain-containing protein [Verrucomicrobiaceae bacterium 227]